MVEQFYGTWKLTDSTNFEEYMKEVGMNVVTRTMGKIAKPTLEVKEEADGMISVKAKSKLKPVELKFKLGEECDDDTADGRKAKSTFTLENGTLVQKQTWNGKTSILEREIQSGKLVTTCKMNDVVSVRTYEKMD